MHKFSGKLKVYDSHNIKGVINWDRRSTLFDFDYTRNLKK